MKTKFLLCFLLGQTVMAYANPGGDRPTTFTSYFERLKSVVTKTAVKKPVNLDPTLAAAGSICRGYPNVVAATPLLWSDKATWESFGASKPVAGSEVTIPADVHIILNESPPDLANLTISGTLEFADQDLKLTAGWIMVMGTLQVGTPESPYTHKAIITLNATDQSESIMGMGTRGIMVMGGKLELHGVAPAKHFTKLNDHAVAGGKSLTLLDAVSWNVQDQIVVATTDFFGAGKGSAQRTQITAINGTSLTIEDGLNAQRWGKLQYLTKTGMSLTPGELPANLLPDVPTILDERAEVANLTRNIVVQSVDDDLWRNSGFGCHIMMMRMNNMVGQARLDGVEIKRGGQSGTKGRYPFHWHMLSYQGSTTLPDVTGQYIRNSTINQSSQRGIVIHGTNGAEVKNNVVYDVLGHGIFTEDAVERRNVIDGNVVLKIRHPAFDKALKIHESNQNRIGSSGFWISNPDNTIINNRAADCEGSGFWMAFPEKTFGASAEIVLKPRVMKFGTFNNNHTHSNQMEGIFLDHAEIDEEGNTADTPQYASTTDMQNADLEDLHNVLKYELGDYSSWKNNQSGIWNRSVWVANRRAVNADNTSSFFSGATWIGSVIEKTLLVGISLNSNMNGVIQPADTYPPVGFSTYNSSIDLKNNVIVNFPAVKGSASGAFSTGYYGSPVDKGFFRNPGNIVINSHTGVRVSPDEPQFTFGIIWDPFNYWGGPASQNNYYVFDQPFFTYGQTRHIVPNGTAEIANGVVVGGPFYGFMNFYVNGSARVYDKIQVTRTNEAAAAVGSWVVEAPAIEGMKFGNMRHFGTHPKGYYYLDFPTIDEVNDFSMNVVAMTSTDDYQVLSVEYSGKYTITQLFASTANDLNEFGISFPFPAGESYVRPYTAVSNFQAVVNAPTGEVYWQDKTSNKVWFKVRGGVYAGKPSLPADDFINLYKYFGIRAYGKYDPLNAPPTKKKQTINFGALPSKLTTDGAFTLSASSDSNLPVSFILVSGPATLSGNTLTLTGTAGTVTVRASQDGDASFDAATAVEQSFQVNTPSSPNKQNQTITFAPLSNKLTTDGAFTLSASSSSNLPVSLSIVSGPATLLGNTLTLTGTAGTVVVQASQGGDDRFNPAPAVQQSFQVSVPRTPPLTKQNQTITFRPLSNKLTTDAAFTLSASTDSRLPVSFSIVSGPASVSGNTLTLTGTAGTVTVRASQGGDASFNPAMPVERSFQVSSPGTPPPPTPEASPESPLVAQLNPRNIFSPNGDGVNESWEVEGIEQQPELRVLIFNSYGQKVFQAQPYSNSWNGAGLPEGVYYYQVQNSQGKPVKKGAVTLVR